MVRSVITETSTLVEAGIVVETIKRSVSLCRFQVAMPWKFPGCTSGTFADAMGLRNAGSNSDTLSPGSIATPSSVVKVKVRLVPESALRLENWRVVLYKRPTAWLVTMEVASTGPREANVLIFKFS